MEKLQCQLSKIMWEREREGVILITTPPNKFIALFTLKLKTTYWFHIYKYKQKFQQIYPKKDGGKPYTIPDMEPNSLWPLFATIASSHLLWVSVKFQHISAGILSHFSWQIFILAWLLYWLKPNFFCLQTICASILKPQQM